MSTSNSTNYTLNATELMTSSFEMIGVAKGGEDLAPEDSATALVTLNIMLKALQQKLNIWKRKTATIDLTVAQVIYTIGQKSVGSATSLSANDLVDSDANFNTDNIQVGDTVLNKTAGTSTTVSTVTSTTELALASDIFTVGTEDYEITNADVSASRPMRILECNRKGTAGDEITINKLTRNEYENLPNKLSPGSPISYHYDPTIANGTFYIWLAPDTAAVNDWTIEFVYQATIEDIDVATDLIDIPSENLEALVISLAYRLSWRFGGITASERRDLKADMNDAVDLAEGYEQIQDGDVRVVPDIREY